MGNKATTEKPLNILLICKSLPGTFKGGIQSHVWDLSASLIERGHQVSILAAGSMVKKTSREEVEGRRIIRIPYFRGRHFPIFRVFLEEIGFCFSVYFWVLKHGGEYDIFHAQGRSGAFLPLRVISRKPFIITYHGLIGVESANENGGWLKQMDTQLHRKLAILLERRPLRLAKHVIHVSNATKEVVQEIHGPAKGEEHIIYNGFQGDLSPVHKRPLSVNLIFVGRLHPIKGLDVLLEAMTQVDKFVKLVLIGDGPMRKQLENQVKSLGLQERVSMMGALSKQEAMAWMEKGFALILPSHFETQGIVLLEANARGIPVLASYAGGMKEVVKDNYNGLFFEAGNAKDMADKINKLFRSPDCQKRMGVNGQKRVKELFHWNSIAQQTESVYLNALNA